MNYMLCLDTYAHSKINCIYTAPFRTIQSAKEKLAELIITGKIVMDREGKSPVKIYCATIGKKREEKYHSILRSDNGINWNKYTSAATTPINGYGNNLDNLLRDADYRLTGR